MEVQEIDYEILLLRRATMPYCERRDEMIFSVKAGLKSN